MRHWNGGTRCMLSIGRAQEGKEIVIRQAREGETLRTLDDKERSLKESMLLICDKEKPAAIAGVMEGGLDSEMKEHTHHIVLESAYFYPTSIRRTSKLLNLPTDASSSALKEEQTPTRSYQL